VSTVPDMTSEEVEEVIRGFLMEHSLNLLETGRQRSIPASFTEYLQKRFGEKSGAYGLHVCTTLFKGREQLDRNAAALLKALEQDNTWPLTQEVLQGGEGGTVGFGEL